MSVLHYKGNLSPALADTIRIDGEPFDLAGSTAKFKMRAEGSSTLKTNAAATVIAASTTLSGTHVFPTGTVAVVSTAGFLDEGFLAIGGHFVSYSGRTATSFLGCSGGSGSVAGGVTVAQIGGVRFDWTAPDVDTGGVEYLGWWEVTLPNTKTQDTLEFVITMLEHAPLARGLCELEDVTAYAPGYKSDPRTDAVIEQFILAASREMSQRTGRELKAITPVLSTRRFDFDYDSLRSRVVHIGDAASISSVKVIDEDQASVIETVAAANYVTLPRNRQEWEPINALYFPDRSPLPAGFSWGRVIEVTGTWGFPAVPADLKEACARLVVFRYVTDVTQAGTQFSESLEGINVGSLFASSRDVIESYGIPLVA